MGLDIYLSVDRTNLISTIDSIKLIEEELKILREKTGVIIDEYGTTKLHLDHIKLLIEIIKTSNEWTIVFQKAIDSNSGLIIEGD